jgi:transposase-like protein
MENEFGLPITVASALEINRRVSEYLRPEYDVILERVRHARIVNVDETSEKVDGVNHWLWVSQPKPTRSLQLERVEARRFFWRF